MKAGVVVFPGSNCDYDCYYVLKHVCDVDASFIWHKETVLDNYDLVVLPGGFSYGDYLRCGAIASKSPVMEKIINFAEKGGYVLGICNGFQVLTESGLLPGALLKNKSLKFICKFVYLRVENNFTPFTNLYSMGEIVKIPIAHMEGNYFVEPEVLNEMKKNSQIVFKYCDRFGEVDDSSNPNGSIENIAGITNKRGNVLGMMPHPERAAEELLGSKDGFFIFKSIIDFIRSA